MFRYRNIYKLRPIKPHVIQPYKYLPRITHTSVFSYNFSSNKTLPNKAQKTINIAQPKPPVDLKLNTKVDLLLIFSVLLNVPLIFYFVCAIEQGYGTLAALLTIFGIVILLAFL